MAMVTYSTKKRRMYVRKFDHDEARLLYVRGWTKSALARYFGVTPQAVARVVDLAVREHMEKKAKAWLMSGVCKSCGGPRTRIARRPVNGEYGSTDQCRTCWGLSRRTRGRFDEYGQLAAVRCSTCKTWRDPDEFASDVNDALGKHEQCRTCSTSARQDYRLRHKVPCAFCGDLCLPPSEKRRKVRGLPPFPLPRCRACFHAWHTVHRRGVRVRLLAADPRIRPSKGIHAERARLDAADALVNGTRGHRNRAAR